MCKIDFKKIKSKITTTQIKQIMSTLGATCYKDTEEELIFSSICHGSNSHKLYYYPTIFTFKCYSRCGGRNYDIISLSQKVKGFKNAIESLKWLCETLNIPFEANVRLTDKTSHIDDWQSSLGRYIRIVPKQQELKIYDDSILNFFEDIYCQDWIDENISIETMIKYEIKFYPYRQQIVIPCRDEHYNFIGARVRNLLPEAVERGFRYMPLQMLNGDTYNFPSHRCLYGLCYNKVAIMKSKKAILVEGEKSVLKGEEYMGDNNICLAIYGSSVSKWHVTELIKLGIEEVILGMDFDYKEYGDEEYDKYEEKMFRMSELFKGFVKVSVMCSHGGHNYKDSPLDGGKETFEKLFENREIIVDN